VLVSAYLVSVSRADDLADPIATLLTLDQGNILGGLDIRWEKPAGFLEDLHGYLLCYSSASMLMFTRLD
jgi:hypothetical protein